MGFAGDRHRPNGFLADETGAVTVDFVPLISAGVGATLALVGVVRDGLEFQTDAIASELFEIRIATSFEDMDFRGFGPAPTDEDEAAEDEEEAAEGEEVAADREAAEDEVAAEEEAAEDEVAAEEEAAEEEDGSEDSGGSGSPGNPGNDKDVGRAGENPNGKDGWGGGSKGRSDG